MRMILNGHPEKIAADLAAARDAVIAGKSAYLDFENEDGEGEIEFMSDSAEFGTKDKLYMEID